MKQGILIGFALAVALPAQAGAPKSELVLVETESRIEMDSAGNLVSVTTRPVLPPAVKAEVEANLRKLHFVPPVKDGQPVAGVTYVQQDACAAPDGGAYRFAVKFRGNGPSLQSGFLPVYPHDAERAGVQSTWKVTYLIDKAGKASVVEAVREQGGGNRFDKGFRTALDNWTATLQYQPEQMDGQPVETKMQESVQFVLGRAADKASEQQRARAAGNDACKLALDARDDDKRAVSLNSPFRRLEAN